MTPPHPSLTAQASPQAGRFGARVGRHPCPSPSPPADLSPVGKPGRSRTPESLRHSRVQCGVPSLNGQS